MLLQNGKFTFKSFILFCQCANPKTHARRIKTYEESVREKIQILFLNTIQESPFCN